MLWSTFEDENKKNGRIPKYHPDANVTLIAWIEDAVFETVVHQFLGFQPRSMTTQTIVIHGYRLFNINFLFTIHRCGLRWCADATLPSSISLSNIYEDSILLYYERYCIRRIERICGRDEYINWLPGEYILFKKNEKYEVTLSRPQSSTHCSSLVHCVIRCKRCTLSILWQNEGKSSDFNSSAQLRTKSILFFQP